MLDEEVYGQPTADELLANEQNVAKVVGQAYSEVKWLHDHWGYWGINTISSDERVNPVRVPGNDWNDDGYWKGFNDHSWTANDLSFEFVWQYSNAGAVLCNKILSQLAGIQNSMDPAVYARFTGELKVLRCYYYYTLFDAFGRIPYQEDYSADRVPQSETWTVWNKLVSTLEAEAPHLPVITDENRAENYGRCSQGFAYALLARLYLNALSFGVTPANCGIEGISTENDFYQKAQIIVRHILNQLNCLFLQHCHFYFASCMGDVVFYIRYYSCFLCFSQSVFTDIERNVRAVDESPLR